LLLIMGLGSQLVHWPDTFCQQLADRGHYVVRFDNRDAGRSTHLPGARNAWTISPTMMSTTGRRGKGRAALRVYRHLFSRRPRTEEEAIERRVRIFRDVGSTGIAQDAGEIRRATARACGRSAP
jgi:pimeloyl-ACP methyl ester carboxylesterase